MANEAVLELICTVVQVRFQKDTYAVCVYKTDAEIPEDAIDGYDPLSDAHFFIATGHGLQTQIGREVCVSGKWSFNAKYGTTQLQVEDCVDHVGNDRASVVEYLSSGILKGVGRQLAGKIYDAFGTETLSVLETEPERLMSIPGIKGKKLQGIISSFMANQDIHILTRLLAPYNVSHRMIIRIRKVLGDGAAKQVKENPYRLCRVQGIGFLTADELALKMGVTADSPARISGAILYAMREAMQRGGHVFITREALIDACIGRRGVLKTDDEHKSVQKEQVEAVIDKLLKDGQLKQPKLAIDGVSANVLFLPNYLVYEASASYCVSALLSAPASPDYQKDWATLLNEAQEKVGIKLADMQYQAALMALNSQFSIITGGPGSGKTTSLRVITQTILQNIPGARLLLAAPTGRAARRMAEQTGLSASTIHSALGLKPDDSPTDFLAACPEYLEADFVIVDETSMMDAALFAELVYRIMPGTKVLFLGDADQLPSVGPGNVLRELLSIPDIIPSVKLDKVFRQGDDSIIPLNAAKVRVGDTDLTFNKDQFHMLYCATEESGADMIRRLVERLMELGRLEEAQILCPMKRRGPVATRNLNEMLHDIVNPPSAKKAETQIGGTLFRVGDKVIQTKNIEKVSNGDMGYVVYAARNGLEMMAQDCHDEAYVLGVKFDGVDEVVYYEYDDALELELATAITIHKSQGSEFPVVIVPIFRSMSFFLRRNLFYTAMTRAQKQVVIVTDKESVAAAIKKEDTSKRNTILSILIRFCHEKYQNGADMVEQFPELSDDERDTDVVFYDDDNF